MAKCKGTTNAGKPCKRPSMADSDYCHHHEEGYTPGPVEITQADKDRELTPVEKRWVAAYIASGSNAAYATRIAYPNWKTVGGHGSLIRYQPHIVAEIRRITENDPWIATARERAAFWTETMRNEEHDIKDRLKAAETLGKVCGDFKTQVELSGPAGGPVEVSSSVQTLSDEEIEVRLKELEAALDD